MYTVYQHKNKINNKSYIGITKQDPPESRWGSNGCNYQKSPRFYAAIQKYGWDNFEHIILYTNLTQEEACEIEKALIKKLNTQDKNYGYNILEGGLTPQMTQETKEKISKAMIGNKNGLGHPCSEEKKEKIRQALIGKPFTEERKKKLSEAAKKRHVPCSEEKKKKLSQNYPYKKKVYCEETNTVYESIRECSRQLNLEPTLVCKVCQGKAHTTGGYHLRYYKEN